MASAPSSLDQAAGLGLDASQTKTYVATRRVLESQSAALAQFFGPLPAVVAVPEAPVGQSTTPTVEGGLSSPYTATTTGVPTTPILPPPTPEAIQASLPLTIVTPHGGHRALQHVLETCEDLEKREALLVTASPLSRHLTALVTGRRATTDDDDVNVIREDDEDDDTNILPPYMSSAQALADLHRAGAAVPRRVCQHPFRKNDIVWVCRTCQADETCVLCHDCFSQSTHEGHDVAFYHAQAGGCCDCGDPDGKRERVPLRMRLPLFRFVGGVVRAGARVTMTTLALICPRNVSSALFVGMAQIVSPLPCCLLTLCSYAIPCCSSAILFALLLDYHDSLGSSGLLSPPRTPSFFGDVLR